MSDTGEWKEIGFTEDFSWTGPAWSIGHKLDLNWKAHKNTGDQYTIYMTSVNKSPQPTVTFLWSSDFKCDTTNLDVRWYWEGEQMNLSLSVANGLSEMSYLDKFEVMMNYHLADKPYKQLVLDRWKEHYVLKKSFTPFTPAPFAPSVSSQLSRAADDLPGINETVKFPCNKHEFCAKELYGKPYSLMSSIIYLNDDCKWTREEIADWIETLDVDTTFKTPTKEIENEQA